MLSIISLILTVLTLGAFSQLSLSYTLGEENPLIVSFNERLVLSTARLLTVNSLPRGTVIVLISRVVVSCLVL